jgi:hypothetical protein
MNVTINFQVNLDTSSKGDSLALAALLGSLEDNLKFVKSLKTECEAPIAPSTVTPEAQKASAKPSQPDAATTPAKRGRKPATGAKQEVALEPVGKPFVEFAGEADGLFQPMADASADEALLVIDISKPITLDDVRAALQKFTSVSGIPAGIELLKKFGANRISELKAEDYAAFVEGCEA